MKRTILALALVLVSAAGIQAAGAGGAAGKKPVPVRWTLAWKEDFSGPLDMRTWRFIDKGSSDWNKKMSPSPELAFTRGGVLHLVGRMRKTPEGGSVCETGGVDTEKRLSFLYGKIEFRAKFDNVRGSWPAAWMMPQPGRRTVPSGTYGEIDIIERLNADKFVYQTLHSSWTLGGHKNQPVASSNRSKVPDPGKWNVYAVEWFPEGLVFYVNGRESFRYMKFSDEPAKWPWIEPYIMRFSMQLGGAWVGAVDERALAAKPIEMQVDWVKYYTGRRGSEKIGELFRDKPPAPEKRK